MTYLVPRKAKCVQPDGRMDERQLEEWRSEPAYILLGDPGSGKTECLRAEANAVGGKLIPALLIQEDLAPLAKPDDIIFIDAVDEARGSSTLGSDVIGAIGRFLRASGYPRFRIACREADWRGEADQQLIESVAPEGKPKVLHLTPLSNQDIRDIYLNKATHPQDIDAFLENADRHGVYDLLRNPLLLDLMINAVASDGTWPATRTEVYQAACLKLAEENSVVHRSRKAMQPGLTETILDDAGTLCAILLLSGHGAISLTGQQTSQAINIHSLPKELNFHDVNTAIKSKVFTIEGDLIHPRHRTIAEYLAACALSKRVQKGLPLSRILALIQGNDGVPVESMRGLCAWLTVNLPSDMRQQMLQLDPIGFIVNGDAAALSHAERILVIRALSDSADKNPWLRSDAWVDHPFGPLATPDMAGTFEQELNQPDRSRGRQAFIDCLMDALKHAPVAMPSLCDALVKWVEDSAAFDGLRKVAYDAWLKHCPLDQRREQLIAWIHAIENNVFDDKEDRWLGQILVDAYPQEIQAEVLRFFRAPKSKVLLGEFWIFWNSQFIEKTPPDLLPAIGDAWVERFPTGVPYKNLERSSRTPSDLLRALLESHGDTGSTDRLYQWLAIGLDEYGVSHIHEKSTRAIATWLQLRPDKMKAIADLGYHRLEPDRHGYRSFRLAEERLHNAIKPTDWIFWNMSLACAADDQDFVRWVVNRAADAVVFPSYGLETPTADDVYLWVSLLSKKHPDAEQWLAEAWTTPLTDWRAENFQRNIRHRAERGHAAKQRREHYTPYLNDWPNQPLPAVMLHEISHAYRKLFFDIEGETPEDRLTDLLGGAGAESVNKALMALDQTLSRDDLPTVQDILEHESNGKEHYLRAAALLAASRVSEHDSNVWRTWAEPLQKQLTAFWLTYGADNEPSWFTALCTEKPSLVAPVMIAYARGKLRRKGIQAITCLSSLHRDATKSNLTIQVLPELLETFPTRAHEEARSALNRYLLTALHLLPRKQALGIIEHKLSLKTLDTGQKIAWLVALLAYEASTITALTEQVGHNQRRVTILGETLHDQEVLERLTSAMPASCVQQLAALLAPLTPRDPNWTGGFVTDERRREDTVRALLKNLGNNPSTEANKALQHLLSMPSLKTWKTEIEFQVHAHQQLRRETSFTPVSPEKVAKLLSNGSPANIKDLQMLVAEHLRQIEVELRGDPTFQLRQFWTDDGRPRTENECRDQILALLRPRLERHKIDLQPESMAADAKRMDMRATAFLTSSQRLSLPIEAKKENHADVWTAWRTQLQALYAIDPVAQGLGIYLVFWFGNRPKSSPEGLLRPTSATDLEKHLKARIPEVDRAKLEVIVMDLAWPNPKPKH